METIKKIIIEAGGKEYQLAAGEGGTITPGVPIPQDTVDSQSIVDGAVEMQDLHDDVKAKIQKTYDEEDETLHMDFDVSDVNNSQNDVGQGGGEDEDLDGDYYDGSASPMVEEEEEI